MLKKLLIVSILCCLGMGCEEKIVSPIPNAPVNLTLDLSSYRDQKLNVSLSYIAYTKETTSPQLESDRFGYGGILVINGLGQDLVNLLAYDLACPNEVQANVKIKADPQETGLATCPQCGAVFNIANGGAPQSGSKYWLKRYNVSQLSDTRYRVTL